MMKKLSLSLTAASLVLVACAKQTVETASPSSSPSSSLVSDAAPVVPQAAYTGLLASFKNCRQKYADIDAKIDAAGVRDASYYRVPGFPYFRTDRTLASFRNEVSSIDEIGGWVRRMREFDQELREFELENLGLDTKERAGLRFDLLGCGRALASIELDNPEVFKRVLASVVPPADYPASTTAAAKRDPQLRDRLLARQQSIMQEFARPLASLESPGPMELWQIKPAQDLSLIAHGYGSPFLDELGFPGLIDSVWAALAETNAPMLWIETGGDHDKPGTPQWAATGADIDIDRPQVHYQVTFTRFGEQRLPQINYLFWFKGQGKNAGGTTNIDGFIWRVTLDDKAQPLTYEIIHLSGRDHEWFPVQPLKLMKSNDADNLPPLLPQKDMPAGKPVLRIQAGTHALRRIVSIEQASRGAAAHQFEMRRYEELATLPKPEGGTRNLFGPDGVIPGARDPDPIWTWGTGISNPGGLRQLGHHGYDFVSPLQFDDPFLLQSIFVAPASQTPAT